MDTSAAPCALVTGGARGAGRGIALALAEDGCDVVIADLLGDAEIAAAAEETAALIAGAGRRAVSIACDVTSAEELDAAVACAIAEFGSIDHLVVNAGVIAGGELDEMTPNAWSRVIDVNLTGAWLTCRAAAPALKAGASGTITVVSSVAAIRGGAGYAAYCASKAGALGMVRALSHELAPYGIRVNAILPGMVATDMWFRSILGGTGADDQAARDAFDETIREQVPLGRPQTAADLGAAVVYLTTATNVTGAELVIDGGRLAGP